MSSLISQGLNVIRTIKDSLAFSLRLLRNASFYKNPFAKGRIQGEAYILANGPSLGTDLPEIMKLSGLEEKTFFVLNYFAFDDAFFTLKPKHYCLADPMFFEHITHRIQDVRRLFYIFQNHVNWSLNIYVPMREFLRFKQFSQIKNKNIEIIPVNITEYSGPSRFRNYFYRKGLAMPVLQNVSILAIYVALTSGCSQIKLYGVDHSFFDSLFVNENNQLCMRNGHFHETAAVRPRLREEDGAVYKISEYVTRVARMFVGHDLLADYARYLGTRVINCTKGSMIDSYERLK